jgi:hypothetical protein
MKPDATSLPEAHTRPPEARRALLHAPVAVLAGALLIVSAVVQLGGPHSNVNEVTIGLITVAKRGGLDIVAGFINAVGLILVALTLNFLYDATRTRQPALGKYMRLLAVAGGAVTGITGVIYAIIIHQRAHQFVSQGAQTYQEAHRLTQGFAFSVLPSIELAGALALAISFALISLAAMRVGLLTKVMGYLGIFTGVLVIIPIGSSVPVIEAAFLVALGALFARRWPGGVPRAWLTGQAEPWPTAAQLREQRVRGVAEGGPPRGRARGRAAAESAANPLPGLSRGHRARAVTKPRGATPEPAPAPTPAAQGRPGGAKRKRKRRH